MTQIISTQNIGKNIINTVMDLKGFYDLFIVFTKNISALKNPAVRSVFYRQLYFSGIEALSKIALIGVLIGIVIITQVMNIVGANAVLTGKILLWTVVREFGPLLVAIIVISRSCSAITSELGSMKVNREVESLRIMGIDHLRYLIIPRIAGITTAVFILTFYFQITAIVGGLALSAIFMDIPFFQHLMGIFSTLSLFEIGASLLKSVVFGLTSSIVSCYQGLGVKASITEIPQAGTRTVMQSLFLVFVSNGIITVIFFL